MEEYVSYHKLIQLFKNYQISQEGIGLNSFGHGNLVMFGMTDSGMTPTYPFMFVTPQQVIYDENIVTYTLDVLFTDRLNDDMSNEIDVISDMDIQARRFMSYIKRGMYQTPNLYDKMDFNFTQNCVPFVERMNDYVGGVVVSFDIILFTDINACDYYAPVSPTPSSTPTNTPTPSVTVTPTPTPTPVPCYTSFNISGSSSASVANGVYQQIDTYSGGTLNSGWIDGVVSTLNFYTGAAPDGKNYKVFGNYDGTYYYTYLWGRQGVSSFWRMIRSSGNYVVLGGSVVGASNFIQTTGSTTPDGLYYYPLPGTNIIPSFTLYRDLVCPTPTPTPTNTLTPTPTNTVTPTNTQTSTPTVTPTNTVTPTTTSTPPVTPTPSRTCPCIKYEIANSTQGVNSTYRWTDCQTGQVITRTFAGVSEEIRCSRTLPVRISGAFLTISNQGPCCVV